MSFRDLELLETIRRDDLAYLLTTRYEKPLVGLLADDSHEMLGARPSPLMVAAFYGSTKCFKFLYEHVKRNYKDAAVIFS